jgi:RloB-like protein
LSLVRSLNPDSVELKCERAAGDPFGIAQRAAKWIGNKGQRAGNFDTYDKGDQVWVVFDRDQHERFEDAMSLCERQGINVARSNPCFEIWLILHHEDCHKPLTRHEAQSRLQQLCPEYDRDGRKTVDAKILQFIGDAEARAEIHLDRRAQEGNAFGASSTTVHLLTKAIRAKP